MLKVEGKVRGPDVDLPCSHEHGLESDALFANVALGTSLRALPYAAYGLEVLWSEAVFVAFDNDAMRVNLKAYEWRDACCSGLCVVVVVGVLKELENETRIACVEVPRETVEWRIMISI